MLSGNLTALVICANLWVPSLRRQWANSCQEILRIRRVFPHFLMYNCSVRPAELRPALELYTGWPCHPLGGVAGGWTAAGSSCWTAFADLHRECAPLVWLLQCTLIWTGGGWLDSFSCYQILDTAPDSGKVICVCGISLRRGLSTFFTRWMHAAYCMFCHRSFTDSPSKGDKLQNSTCICLWVSGSLHLLRAFCYSPSQALELQAHWSPS